MPDPWEYAGNRQDEHGDLRCPGCPLVPDYPGVPCLFGQHQQTVCRSGIKVGNAYMIHEALSRSVDPGTLKAVAGQLTAAQVVAIETCTVRTAPCSCLTRAVECRRSGTTEMNICLTGGVDGGVCPGVH